MMNRKRGSFVRAPASLADLYPLNVTTTEPAGRVFFRELPATEAVYVLKAYRVTVAWCRDGAPGRGYGAVQIFAWKREFTATKLSKDIWYSLIALAEQLSREHVDRRRVANACMAVADWAIGMGARSTALLFAEVAAAADFANPRYAYVVGRLARRWERFREAEHWLLRTVRMGARVDDRYAQTLGLNSLANLHRMVGDYPQSREYLLRALKMARRFHLHELEGEILHDLSLLSTFMRRYAEAERFGSLALVRYGPRHPNIAKLRHDLALIWAEQGSFERAMGVFQLLLPSFSLPEERLRTLTALVHCSGGAGERGLFERYWAEAWSTAHDPRTEPVLAAALLDMGRGAAALGEWSRAESALNWVLRRARDAGEEDALAGAQAVLEEIRKRQA